MKKHKIIRKITTGIIFALMLALLLAAGLIESSAETSTVNIGEFNIEGDVSGYTYDSAKDVLTIEKSGEYLLTRESGTYGYLSIVISADAEVSLKLMNVTVYPSQLTGSDIGEAVITVESGSLKIMPIGTASLIGNASTVFTGTAPVINGNVTVSGEGSLTIQAPSGLGGALDGGPGGIGVDGDLTIVGSAVKINGGTGGSLYSGAPSVRGADGGYGVSGNVTVTNGALTVSGGGGGSVSTTANGAFAGRGANAINGDLVIVNSTVRAIAGSSGAGTNTSDYGMAVGGELTINSGSFYGECYSYYPVVRGAVFNGGSAEFRQLNRDTFNGALSGNLDIGGGIRTRILVADKVGDELREQYSVRNEKHIHIYSLEGKPAGDFVVASELNLGYTFESDILKITEPGFYEIGLAEGITSTENRINVLADGVTLRFLNVKIIAPDSTIPIVFSGEDSIIEASGECVLMGGANNPAIAGNFIHSAGVIEYYGSGYQALSDGVSSPAGAKVSITAGNDRAAATAKDAYTNEKYVRISATYTVTLDHYDNEETISVDAAGLYTAPIESPFVYNDYHLLGWRMSANDDAIMGLSVFVNSDITLYAKWEKHKFVNGICNACNAYEVPELISDSENEFYGYYELWSLGNLMWFAQHVNSGNPNANAHLNDLHVNITNQHEWVPIGSGGVVYTGRFVGEGGISITRTIGGGLFGLFGEFAGYLEGPRVVVNVTLNADHSADSENAIGAIGVMRGGTVKNIEAHVNLAFEGASTAYAVGGVAGYMEAGVIDGATTKYFNLSVKNKKICYAGGIVGLVGGASEAIIKNTYSYSNIKMDASTELSHGGIVGRSTSEALRIYSCYTSVDVYDLKNTYSVANIYYIGDVLDNNVSGVIVCNDKDSLKAASHDASQAVLLSDAEVAQGRGAYILGGDWGQMLSGNKDKEPRYGAPKVYYGYDSCDNDAQKVYLNVELLDDKPAHNWVWTGVGAELRAECQHEKCDDLGSFRLVLPEANELVYDGTVKSVSVVGAAQGVDTPSIEYLGERIQVGNYSARIMIGYAQASVNIVITPREVKASEIALSNTEFLYTGSHIKPDVTVVVDGAVLEVGEDYTTLIKGNTNAGEASITIRFYRNYSGTHTLKFTIKPLEADGITVDPIPDVIYAKSYMPAPEVVLRDKNGAVIPSMNYTLRSENDDGVGTATLYITLCANYTGSIVTDYKIVPLVLEESEVEILDVGEFVENGQPHTPEPTIIHEYTTLVRDVDYTLSYLNNLGAGTATLVIDFIGNYDGEIRQDFMIHADLAPVIGISIAAVPVVGVGVFALVWFVFKKKKWADLIAVFKRAK